MILKNFVVFEGIDGSGTTSQLEKLQADFAKVNKAEAYFTAEPSKAETGLFLRRCLSGAVRVHPKTMTRLFATDRCEHLYGDGGVLEQLQAGKAVFTDRYLFSSLAYQSATGNEAEAKKANEDFPLPEYLFYFDIDVQTAFERVNKRGGEKEIYEKAEFQKKVRDEYLKIMDYYEKAFPEMKLIRIDATQSIEEIYKKVWSFISHLPTL